MEPGLTPSEQPSEAKRARVTARLAAIPAAFVLLGATLSPAPAIHEIDWRTSPLDLNLRGQNGERFCFRCPPGKVAAGGVIGSGPYTDGSSICAAATHAGVIRPATGGVLTIEVRPGQAHFVGTLSHFVQSEPYDPFWSGSFLVFPGHAAFLPRARLPNRFAGNGVKPPSQKRVQAAGASSPRPVSAINLSVNNKTERS